MLQHELAALRMVSDPRVSPAGDSVLFVISWLDLEVNREQGAIWIMSLADDGAIARRLPTGFARSPSSPRWSPDGSSLAFVAGDATRQLYVAPIEGGPARRLTDQRESVADPVWSPDGRLLAYTARVPALRYAVTDLGRQPPRRVTTLSARVDGEGWVSDRPRQVFVVDVATGQSVSVTDDPTDHTAPCWRPDSAAVAYVRAPPDVPEPLLARAVYSSTLDGETTRVCDGLDALAAPSWSPDGRQIACRLTSSPTDGPSNVQIMVMNVESRERKVLTETMDRNCDPRPRLREPVWVGEDVVFAVEDRGQVHLYRTPASGSGSPKPLVDGDGIAVTGFDVVEDRLVYAASSMGMPPELYTDRRRLTCVRHGLPHAERLVEPTRFHASTGEREAIDAWAILPSDPPPDDGYPMVLAVHGGPFWQFSGFQPDFQTFAAAGYAVVYSNPRGSSGRGEAWARSIRGAPDEGGGWGTVDFDDLMAVLDAAADTLPVDPARAAIIGLSYGGYMAAWAIAHTSRFAAACAENPVTNLISCLGTSDWCWTFPTYIDDLPYGDAFETYWRPSPVAHVDKTSTPLLIVCSEDDLRCPPGQSEELFVALRLLDREVELLRFPSGSHDFATLGSPLHRMMRYDAILDWWARHL